MTILNLDNLSPAQTSTLNTLAKDILPDYLKLLESLIPQDAPNYWLFSSILSRNPYISNLHTQLTQLALVQHEINGLTKVITSDPQLAKVLKQHFPKLSIQCTASPIEKLKNYLKPCIDLLKSLIYLTPRVFSRKKQCFPNTPITLVETFVYNKSGNGGFDGKTFNERYYPGLRNHLSFKENQALYFLPTFINYKNQQNAFKQCRNSSEQFLIPDDFLKLSDYINILKQPFLLLKKYFQNVTFRDIDISHILDHENQRNAFNFPSLLAHLNFIFCKRFKERNGKLRFLLSWYENQPQDRGLIKGIKTFFPNTHVTGYQGFIISPIYNFNICPTSLEQTTQSTPHTLALTGPALFSPLTAHCSQIPTTSAPAFRSQKVFAGIPKKTTSNILVALPISPTYATPIVHAAHYASKQLPNTTFIFKPHPGTALSLLPDHVQYTAEDFYDLLSNSTLLITTASSTAIEALALNTPTIIYEPLSKISNNPIPSSIPQEIWKSAYSHQELLKSIQDLQSTNYTPTPVLKTDYFTQPTRENIRKLLNLN